MNIRQAAVAGQFYPAEPNKLKQQVNEYLRVNEDAKKESVSTILVPHAGYIYSGRVAGAVYSLIKPASSYILLGPNHTSYSETVCIAGSGLWRTPLGDVQIDEQLSKKIIASHKLFSDDELAHRFEHSLEVQLPFLQVLHEDLQQEFKIVPIIFPYLSWEGCIELSETLSELIGDSVVIISSDMTHYQPHEVTQQKDKKAIDAMLKLDTQELFEVVKREGVTMCGLIPAVVGINIASRRGITSARLVMYETSAAASGDYRHTVGYAGMIFGSSPI